MERTTPTDEFDAGRTAQVRRRVARALVANYIHEVSDKHGADAEASVTDGESDPPRTVTD